MASAHSARAPRRTSAPRSKAPTRAGSRQGIRWDRLSRVALLVVFFALLLLYIGPARSYWSTRSEAKQRREQVSELKRENTRLHAQRTALSTSDAVEREARRLGMVRRGERSYAIKNLPR